MNYEEALTYINQLSKKGISLGLERMEQLLALLGNPQEGLRCIHVAGTNGKGSVCAFLNSALRQAGLRVGRYSSPTLYDYRERIQINGVNIGKDDLAALLTIVQQACRQMAQQGQETPTVFEVETALAFLYFQQQRCDYVLLEVGLGGRLDSTNVIQQPVLSVITAISLDHTVLLGDTLAAIAAEKGGIIKAGCPVVLSAQQPEALAVLLERCKACGVQPMQVDATKLQAEDWSRQSQRFSYGRWEHLTIGLLGDYQRMNAATALEALQFLQQREPALTDAVIYQALAEARWSGRFEIILQRPLFIVDGAHNPAGAQSLAQTLKQHFCDKINAKKIWLLMGVFADKDYQQIGQILSSCSNTIFCFQPAEVRGLDSAALAAAMQPYYTHIVDAQTAAQAVQQVLAEAAPDDVIVSFGSLSTIKAVQDAVQQWEVQHETN